MKAKSQTELWARLLAADFVKGDLPMAKSIPWFIRTMLGIGGWIGALFIMGFIFGLFPEVERNILLATVMATACCLGAGAIYFVAPDSIFASQFALAIGLTGQVLFCMAIFRLFNPQEFWGYFYLFCLEIVLTLFMFNFTQRIFTTLAVVAALFLGFAQAGLHELALPVVVTGCALVWRGEQRLAGWGGLWQPVGYGLALGALFCAATLRFGEELLGWIQRGGGGWLPGHGEVIGSVLIGGVFLAVTVDILRKLDLDPFARGGLVVLLCTLMILGATFPAHGLATALLILVLGVAGGNRIIFAFGLLALAAFLSFYYYQMKETLLFKSLVLSETGTLLLAIRWGLGKLFPASKEASNA